MAGSVHESYEPVMLLNQMAAQVSNDLMRHQWRALNDWMQCNAEQWQQLSRARGVDELVATQSRFIAKSSPKLLGYAQDTLDCLVDAASQYRKIMVKAEQNREQSGD